MVFETIGIAFYVYPSLIGLFVTHFGVGVGFLPTFVVAADFVERLHGCFCVDGYSVNGCFGASVGF